MKNNAANRAIEHFGTQANLARALNVQPQLVYQWSKRGLPAKRAKQISDASGGAIKLEELL